MDEIEERLMRARISFLRRDASPFFATILLHHKFVRADIGTVATDGHTLLWDADYVAKLSPEQLKGLLAHEVLHVARAHHMREEGRNHQKWNIACDAAIDHDLKTAGFDVPESFADKPEWDWARGLSAEVIYARMPEQMGGGGGIPRPGEVRPTPSPDRAAEEARQQIMIRQAIMAEIAKGRERGDIPAWLKALMDGLTAPKVAWQDVLRRFLGGTVPNEYSWRRPNRRYRSLGIYMPGIVCEGLAEGIILNDTSGSMSTTIKPMLAETAVIINDLPRDRVHVIQCDAAVADFKTYEPGDMLDLNVAGFGGSDFRPAFERIEQEGLEPRWMVVISDMQIAWPETPPSYPVLAFSTTDTPGPDWAQNFRLEV